MVQEMNILRCYSCHMFQVHIVKKANKWQCKICNEKQSIQHVYYKGSGQDCRLHVQSLNFTKNNRQQDGPEALKTIEDVEKKRNNAGAIKKPASISSKWTKYMVPETESRETGSNDEKDVEKSPFNLENNISYDVNSFVPDFKISNDAVAGVLMNQRETEAAFSSRNEVVRDLTRTGLRTGYSSCNSGTIDSYEYKTNFGETEVRDEGGDSPSRSSRCSYNLNHEKQNIIIHKHGKRKSQDENSGPESEWNSFSSDREPAGKIFKRTNSVDQFSLRKQYLRDIVKENRKSLDTNVEKRPGIADGEAVLKEMNDIPNVNRNVSEVSDPNAKKNTIFETGYDNLDEILDF